MLELPPIADFVNAQIKDSSNTFAGEAGHIEVQAAGLVETEFRLLEKKLEYDLGLYDQYKTRTRDFETQSYFKRQEHRLMRHQKACEVVSDLLENTFSSWMRM